MSLNRTSFTRNELFALRHCHLRPSTDILNRLKRFRIRRFSRGVRGGRSRKVRVMTTLDTKECKNKQSESHQSNLVEVRRNNTHDNLLHIGLVNAQVSEVQPLLHVVLAG